jgi:acetyl-CoA carboxylase carboxyl transferase subunit alpha
MLEHAIYTVASPEAAASILWRDAARAIDAATGMKITAQDLKGLGVIDVIIPEPVGGAHRDAGLVFRRTGDAMAKALGEFSGLAPEAIRRQRHDKFLAIGRNL